jgi:hypothetical protein
MKNIQLGKTSISFWGAITLALMPILSTYQLFGPFTVAHILIGISVILTIGFTKKVTVIYPLLTLFSIHALLSTFAYFSRANDLYIEKIIPNLIYTGINVVCVMLIIRITNKQLFFKAANIICIAASVFIFFQFALLMNGINPPDGRIPGLPLAADRGWAEIDIQNIYRHRVHSFFAEPSYFAIYLLPVLSIALIHKRYLLALFFLAALFVSTSSLGIIGGLFIFVLYIMRTLKVKDTVLLLTLVIVMGAVWYFIGFGANDLFAYNLNKIENLNEHSKIRLTGYLNYYQLLPDLQKMIGIGYNQLQLYFFDYHLKNYSNAFVLSLINFGLLGFLTLVGFIISLFVKLKAENKIFIIIFALICTIDAFLYNLYFYYILAFVFISLPPRKGLET